MSRQKRTNLVLADELLLWSSSNSLIEWSQNPVLQGHTAYLKFRSTGASKPNDEWEMHPDTHPDQRLLTDEEAHELRSIRRRRRRQMPNAEGRYQLTGRVCCHHCGYKMELKRNANYRYYGCSMSGCQPEVQRKSLIRVEVLEESIAKALHQRANHLTTQASLPGTTPSQKLQDLHVQLEAVEPLVTQFPDGPFKQTRHDLQLKIEQLKKEQDFIQIEKATAQEIISHPLACDLSFWATRTYAEREFLYDKLLDTVFVSGKTVMAVKLTV
ncbi:MAG: zinc ribbon domain-containing protein [Elainellaceae cyanobacterium]